MLRRRRATWRGSAPGSRLWRCTPPSPRWCAPRWRSSAQPRASSRWPTRSWPRHRASWTRCRTSSTACRRTLTRRWPPSSASRTTLTPRSARWTRPTSSSTALRASATAGRPCRRSSPTRRCASSATWPSRAASSPTWGRSTPTSVRRCSSASTRAVWTARSPSPRTSKYPPSSSTQAPSATGHSRACLPTSSRCRTASW
mmetsp:Transcript_2703/g.7735  ORF Transcript_2703/g.7735 Transcript_2703/m.7735 type:complete len:200 (-) Transcript_2703:3455-4054(-)